MPPKDPLVIYVKHANKYPDMTPDNIINLFLLFRVGDLKGFVLIHCTDSGFCQSVKKYCKDRSYWYILSLSDKTKINSLSWSYVA